MHNSKAVGSNGTMDRTNKLDRFKESIVLVT